MTRNEAVDYINAHPAMFKGYQLETVLARINSIDNPDFYDPTLFTSQAGDFPATPAPKKVAAKAPAAPAYVPPSKTNIIPSSSSLPALPVTLAIALLALGAGMAIYKATR